jgi:hypothetical protein
MSSSKSIRRTAVTAGCALVVAVTLTAGPAQANRPALDGRVPHATHVARAAWDGEQNMAVRHRQMTVDWRLGLGG